MYCAPVPELGLTLTITTRPWVKWLVHPVGKAFLTLILLGFLATGLILIHVYNVYAGIIDRRLSATLFVQPSMVFAAPYVVRVGETVKPEELATELRRSGYADGKASPVGTFIMKEFGLQVRPGPEAYHSTTPVNITFDSGTVSSISNLDNGEALDKFELEPQFITTLFDQNREKRRLLHYQDLPPRLIQAVLDAEDRDFFHHGAVVYWRIPVAFYRDVRRGRLEQGASTITQQVARNMFLSPEKTWQRKAREAVVALELEQRLTKEQIFELYANEVYLGQRGTYSIHGFGEAAEAYFGKDVKDLTLPECAMIAGIIHGPNVDSPYRHPELARDRRNWVLGEMVMAGSITSAQRDAAVAAPLSVQAANSEASEAPYFVDLVRDKINDQLPDRDPMSQSYRIYTTLDPDLQAAAARAIRDGLKEVDKALVEARAQERRRRPKNPAGFSKAQPQIALIAIDPHTGAILAFSGGRDYALSQLDHALAQRPTGSIFKPFVYATALETGLLPTGTPYTQSSTVMDEPTTFEGNYQPQNFAAEYMGRVTLRTALEHSLNNGTIALAEEVGLHAVTDLAHAAGIVHARPTPSEAIGAYDANPLQMTEAYTVFANGGVKESLRSIVTVQTPAGETIYQEAQHETPVLDPKVAFLTTNLMQSVLQGGTGVRVHEYGFDVPAAGKTGTDHDAWFAGYTDNLLCVVWVGLDDYTDILLQGADAALPIWARFMKSATSLPAYRDVTSFPVPDGIVSAKIDTESGQLATPQCPGSQVETEYYIDGTQPTQYCPLHGGLNTPRGVIADASASPPPVDAPLIPPADDPATHVAASRPPPPRVAATPPPPKPAPAAQPKKKGFFGRLWGEISGGGNPEQ